MDGKVVANIIIAGRSYRTKIVAEDEKTVKEAEVLIKNKMDRYYKDHSDIDTRDRLAIAFLNVTSNALETQKLNNKWYSEIEELDRRLGLYLEKQVLWTI